MASTNVAVEEDDWPESEWQVAEIPPWRPLEPGEVRLESGLVMRFSFLRRLIPDRSKRPRIVERRYDFKSSIYRTRWTPAPTGGYKREPAKSPAGGTSGASGNG